MRGRKGGRRGGVRGGGRVTGGGGRGGGEAGAERKRGQGVGGGREWPPVFRASLSLCLTVITAMFIGLFNLYSIYFS